VSDPEDGGAGVEASARRYLAGLCVPAASTDNRHQSPDRGDLPTFTSAKLVFDLATRERYKAELT